MLSSALTVLVMAARLSWIGAIEGGVECPNIKPMQDFNSSRLPGEWYVVLATNNSDMPEGSTFKCITSTLTLLDNGTFAIFYTYKFISDNTGKLLNANLTATPINGMQYKQFIQSTTDPEYAYIDYIIATDYDTYIVYVKCVGKPPTYFIQVSCRKNSLPEQTDKEVRTILANGGIPVDNLKTVDQNNCSSSNN